MIDAKKVRETRWRIGCAWRSVGLVGLVQSVNAISSLPVVYIFYILYCSNMTYRMLNILGPFIGLLDSTIMDSIYAIRP